MSHARLNLRAWLIIVLALLVGLTIVGVNGVTASAATASTLQAGQRLGSGARLVAGDYRLIMQTDGNLVEYRGSGVIWSSHTNDGAANTVIMQSDGNLVVYGPSGAWRWQSATGGHSGSRLVLQTDGNTVVYAGTTAVWAATWRQDVGGAQHYASSRLAHYGWGSDQLSPLLKLWNRESTWLWNARNSSSGAYGIPQALPAGKLTSAGPDWETNGQTQVAWGLAYIADTYGSPAAAWQHEVSHGWY